MTTARQKVLAYLRRQGAASARQIAGALNMTPANVRHHLGILVSDGRVEVTEARRGKGRGRPAQVYLLSRSLRGDHLAGLLDAVLAEWLGRLSPARREEALRALARGLAGAQEASAAPPIQKRLALSIERLNAMHYQARWEAGAEGPRLILGNCPYAAIIAKHPELCTMDAFLLAEGLGAAARQTAKLERDLQGRAYCVFVISRR